MRAILSLLSSIALALTLAGCSAAGILAYKVMGPPKVDAKYTPAQTPMLVLAENTKQPSATIGPEALSLCVIEQLNDNKVAPVIPAEKLQELRDTKLSKFNSMSVSAIGTAVGAAQVLYIEFDRDSVLPLAGGESMQGQIDVRVKVIDVASGHTLWPTDVSAGYPLSASSTLGSASSKGTVQEVRKRMYLSLADQIARLFYKWQPEFQNADDIRG